MILCVDCVIRCILGWFAGREREREPNRNPVPFPHSTHTAHRWISLHSKPPPRRGNDGSTHLLFELDNAQVKVATHASPDPALPLPDPIPKW